MTEVSQDRLMAHMREFARRIKLSGTPEELESFHYLQSVLDGYGYKTTLISHDAYISLPGKARLEVDGVTPDCITHSMSRPAPEGVQGEVIFVGNAAPDSLANRDLAGKIWLVDGIATPDIAVRARDAGALAEIHISPTEHRYEMCVSPVWGSPSPHTLPLLPTTPIVSVNNIDGAKIRTRCQGNETVTARLQTEVDTGWRKTPILVADLDTDDDRPFVLLSGHHDTWYFGVMDNGGANATMLEAAHALAAQRQTLRRGLRLCFWSGHSHGRYSGSAWYADEHWDELDRSCVAHVNVDSTGGEGATILSKSTVTSDLKHVAAQAVHAVAGSPHDGLRPNRNSDASFWGIGIPSIFGSVSTQPPDPVTNMRNALGWWWHTPHDLLDRIDPANLVRDTKIVLAALENLLQSETIPLDHAATADALHAELTPLDLGPAYDLTPLLDTIRTNAKTIANASPAQANPALMQAARALVPLNHTKGDRFTHDPALPLPPFPALDALRDLARHKHAPDRPFYEVAARQSRNRIAHALRQAIAALNP